MIEYATKKEADAAVQGANDTEFLEQTIHVYVHELECPERRTSSPVPFFRTEDSHSSSPQQEPPRPVEEQGQQEGMARLEDLGDEACHRKLEYEW